MPESSILTEEMLKAIGMETKPATYEIEKGHIRRFAEAIGDSNVLFTDENAARKTRYGSLIVPPTFFRALLSSDLPPVVSEKLRKLDGGSQWEYFEPVRPGDRITVTAKYVSFTTRQGRMGEMLLAVVEITYKNQFDEVAATQRTTSIRY